VDGKQQVRHEALSAIGLNGLKVVNEKRRAGYRRPFRAKSTSVWWPPG
jgi:hypothetical protein